MRSLFLICLILVPYFLEAQSDTLSIRRLSSAWVSHDERGEPFQALGGDDVSVGGFFLSEEELGQDLLRICGEKYDFWVNGRLLLHDGSDCEYFTATDLFADHLRDTVYCAVISSELEGVVVDLQRIQPAVTRLYDLPGARLNSMEDNVWWILMLTVLILMSMLRVADDQSYRAMMRLSFLQRRVGYEEDAMLSLSNLLMMLLLGLLLGFHIVVVTDGLGDIGSMLGTLGNAALYFYGFLIVKMLLLQLSGSLFRYRKTRTLHFRAYLLYMTIFMFLLFLMQLGGHWFEIEAGFYWRLIQLAGPLISAVFVIWIYFQLSSELSKRKLHIISYLCTTEILPTFVLANWLLN